MVLSWKRLLGKQRFLTSLLLRAKAGQKVSLEAALQLLERSKNEASGSVVQRSHGRIRNHKCWDVVWSVCYVCFSSTIEIHLLLLALFVL